MGFFSDGGWLGFLSAAIPGVLIALLSYQLTVNREERLRQQKIANSRMLLALELSGNLDALRQFWQTINGLDADNKSDPEAHLATMTEKGLLTYTLPTFSVKRWEADKPAWLGGLAAQDVKALDGIYRDLKSISEMYRTIITITPSEQAELEKDRFWYNRFAWMRQSRFKQLADVVNRVLAQRHPLAGS